eukprot:1157900-Pelagomonas_calceolata.AAC.17
MTLMIRWNGANVEGPNNKCVQLQIAMALRLPLPPEWSKCLTEAYWRLLTSQAFLQKVSEHATIRQKEGVRAQQDL